jgi:DNA-binding NtrC family response regulator
MVPSTILQERESKLSLLLDLSAMLASEVELDTLLGALGHGIARAMHAERATIYLVDAGTGELRSQVADLPEMTEIRLPPGKGVAGYVADKGEVVNIADAASDPRHFSEIDRTTGYRTRNMLTAPIRDGQRVIRGVVQVLNKEHGTFTPEDEAFLLALATQVAQAFERTTLRPDARTERGVCVRGLFNHIVGDSLPMRKVYELVLRAATTDATVLLTGPTGVGKGLFARAIHANCSRSQQPFVTVDCTTLPTALVESELFGHERGAYTGADRQVRGKVEMAEGGTLFLDEVGDLPLDTQAKLLRFLQERTFERVGGRQPLTANVRIIAATHHNLERLTRHGAFRQDLFYRIRVVDIVLPSLAERGPKEIESLAFHFLDVYARRHRRPDVFLSPESIQTLCQHDWPGNVRELEHTIERAVVLSAGNCISPEFLGLMSLPTSSSNLTALVPPALPTIVKSNDTVTLPLGLSLEEASRHYLEATIATFQGNLTRAAHSLKIGRNTLKRRAQSCKEKKPQE